MPEATASFLSNYTETISVPDHMPLVCLVFYIFLEFDDDKHRVEQLKTLFYRNHDPDNLQQLEDVLRQDKKSLACLETALAAKASGQIEQYHKDYDFEHFERDKVRTPEFYTVSFLAWAESAGHEIPGYITKELGRKIEHYYTSKLHRDEERRKFPEIDRQEFERRANEPLWQMTDAILYALGYQSRAATDVKVSFLKYKDRAKRLMNYVLDAHKAHDLKLYDFDDHLFDVDQKDIEEKRLKSFYASKVKPKEFVPWLCGLSLELPVIGQYITPDKGSQPPAETLPNKFGFENLLHPLIVKSSYQQYCDGHLRNAVCDSITVIFDRIRERTGLDLDGENLISHALSLTDPYIILSELTSESGKNDQKGFIQILKGAYQGIRNPKAHSLVHDLTEHKAAQYLVFASLLARRIEEASFPKAT